MFTGPVDVDLLRQFEVGLKPAARPDVFQTVHDFRSVGARFLLYKDIETYWPSSVPGKVGDIYC